MTNGPAVQIQLPFRLDSYHRIRQVLDAIKPLFPEQTSDTPSYASYSKTSNYRFSIKGCVINEEYKGTRDFLNVIYRNERVELASMTINNFDHGVNLALLNSSTLLLFANDIAILEDYERKIKNALGLEVQEVVCQDVKQEVISLEKNYDDMISKLNLFNEKMLVVIKERIAEIAKAVANSMPLAAMFLIGSTLEGVLSAVAQKYPREFNSAVAAPKKEGKVLPLSSWVLGSLIDVACEVKVLRKDVRGYSVQLRDFRNYIHPNEQVKQNFSPTMNTVKISISVLSAVLNEISTYIEEHAKG